ncbi:MAG: DUF1987 domain-containing protein [Cyclobacteriaceae bacterium]
MEKIFIEPSRVTPLIAFDPETNILEIKGRSSPENSILFYEQVMNLIDQLIEEGVEELTANFSYEYFNTSSSKCLFDVFKKLMAFQDADRELIINWHYEEDDEDMMEAGEDYADLLDLEINFIELEEF